MGKIVKNGVTYSGSSDNADNVKYNNNVSNLDATNVQEAIDKLDESVDTLNSNLAKKLSYKLYSFNTGTLSVGTTYISIPELNTTNLIGCSVVSASPSYSYSDLSDIEFRPSDNKLAITVKYTQNINLKVIAFYES